VNRRRFLSPIDRPVAEALEPRLLLDAQIDYLEVVRCTDYNEPGAGDEDYEYRVAAEGPDLIGLAVTAPWGAVGDSANYLPAGWAGEPFEGYFPGDGIWIEARSWYDGVSVVRLIELEWEGISPAQWGSLDTGVTALTVTDTGGSWSGVTDFSSVTQPVQEPTLASPLHGETNVELAPTFEIVPWASPGPGQAGIEIFVIDDDLDVDLYEVQLDPYAGQTQWTGPDWLDPGATYELEIDFWNAAQGLVNGVEVTHRAAVESDPRFTTRGLVNVVVDRGVDYEFPTDAVEERLYAVMVSGVGLTNIQVTTPWGAAFDAANDTPGGFPTGEFGWQFGDLEFWGYFDGGLQWYEMEWLVTQQTDWDQVETSFTVVNVDYAGGSWGGVADFSGAPLPDAPPTVTNPLHQQLDAPLLPTFQWDPWANPLSFDPGVWFELTEAASHFALFEQPHEPAGTTEWTPPFPLAPSTQHQFSIDFHNGDRLDIDGTFVSVTSWAESDILFTTVDSEVTEVWMERVIDYGIAYREDDGLVFRAEIVGAGIDRVEILTPWGETADTDALLPSGWQTQDHAEVLRGPMSIDTWQWGGTMEIEFEWVCLTDLQWFSLDAAATLLAVTHGGGSLWTAGLDFTGVTQPLLEPLIVSPVHRDVASNFPTIEWLEWTDPPATGGIYVSVEEDPSSWEWTGLEYEEEAFLDAAATTWTPPALPDSDGLFETEVGFVDFQAGWHDGADIYTLAASESDTSFLVGGPEASVRVDPLTGNTFFLTPRGTWEDCQAYAESFGGNLVTLNDADEEQWLRDQYGNHEWYWIGYNDIAQEGVWVWAGGEAPAYTNWDLAQPDNGGGGMEEDAAVMNWTNDQAWWAGGGFWWNDVSTDHYGGQIRGIVELPAAVPLFGLADDHGNTPFDATPVAPGAHVGEISYHGDIDFFSFNATAGQAYDILVDLPETGGVDDSTLWLYDTDGATMLTWDDDGGYRYGSRIVWTAPADGTYFLAVDSNDLLSQIEEFGSYFLDVALSGQVADVPLATMQHPAGWLTFPDGRGAGFSQPGDTGADAEEALDMVHLFSGFPALWPTEVGTYALEDLEGAAVMDNEAYVYLADGSNRWNWPGPGFSDLVVLEILGPGEVVEANRVRLANPSVGGLAAAGEYLYAVTQDQYEQSTYLEICHVPPGDPANPVPVGLSPGVVHPDPWGYWPEMMAVDAGRAYILYDDPGWILVFDVSDPSNPVLMGDYLLTGPDAEAPFSLAVADQVAWVATEYSVQAIDLSDPTDGQLLSVLPLGSMAGDMVMGEHFLFVGCGATGGCAIDVADPQDPAVVRTYSVPGATGGLGLSNGRVYIPTGAGQISIHHATLEADLNLDGAVDYFDYAQARDNFPAGGEATWGQGDIDGNGLTDHVDYLLLKVNYGASLLAGSVESLAPAPPAAAAATAAPAPAQSAAADALAVESAAARQSDPAEAAGDEPIAGAPASPSPLAVVQPTAWSATPVDRGPMTAAPLGLPAADVGQTDSDETTSAATTTDSLDVLLLADLLPPAL